MITHEQMVAALRKPGDAIAATVDAQKLDLLHMAVGVAGEAGELLDAFKKHVFYNKPIDLANVVEELGDIEFYLQGIRATLNLQREVILRENMDKLLTGEKARYKFGYSDAAAQARSDKA